MEKNYDSLKLERQLCFPMYACAKEIVRRYAPLHEPLGLTYTQYLVMMVLWEKCSVNVKELGKCLYLDSGTLTPLLKKLETTGYITRSRSAADERQLIVTLTGRGEALREEAVCVPGKMGKCVDLSAEETAFLYRTLYKILGQVGEPDTIS